MKQKIAAALLGVAVAVLSLEAASRFVVGVGDWPLGDRYLVERTPYFTPTLSPELPYYGDTRLSADARGLHFLEEPGASWTASWEHEGLRIVCLGDSLTQIWPAPDQVNYTRHLSGLLSETLGAPVEVLPLGVGGYIPAQAIAAFGPWLSRLSPDLLLLQLGPNDLDSLARGTRGLRSRLHPRQWPEAELRGRNQKRPQARPRSHALWWWRYGFGRWRNGDRNFRLALAGHAAELPEALAAFSAIAKELGVPSAALVFPFFEGGHTVLEEDRLASLLQAAEIPSLLLREPMSSASAGGIGALSIDGIHPNQDGHRVAAEAIAPYVLPMLER